MSRPCQCPRDGTPYSATAQYCPSCAFLAARASVPLVSPPTPVTPLVQAVWGGPAPHPGTSAVPVYTAREMEGRVYRSKTEARYAQLLDEWQREGHIVRWRYEAIRLTLAPHTTLLVDFPLTFPDGHMELHEVKGQRWLGATGRAKLKCAAVLWPELQFVLVEWDRDTNQWRWQDVPAV